MNKYGNDILSDKSYLIHRRDFALVIKKEKTIIFLGIVTMLFVGVLSGAFYMASQPPDKEFYEYLEGFVKNINLDGKRLEIFLNSLKSDLGIVLLISISGFFRIGIVLPFFASLYKGFVTGYTMSAFIRYFGARGLFVPLSSMASELIFIPALVVFSAVSACFSLKKRKKTEINRYLATTAVFVLIFTISSFFDGYITPTFIKLFSTFIVKS